MIQKTMARIAAVLALAALLFTGMAPAAQAATGDRVAASSVSITQIVKHDGEPPQKFSVCQTSTMAANSSTLPVNRWQGATNELHSRMEGGINVGSFMGTIHRDFVVGSGMSFGNFLWAQGANLAEFSIGFCMLNKMGGAADGIGKTIGEVMIFGAGAPILVLLVVASLISIILKGRNGSINWQSIFQKAIVVGLLGFMTLGSMNSTGGGINGSTADYKPGVGSPGWVVTTINNTVASLASAPAMALAVEQPDSGGRSSGLLSCKNYVSALNTKYMEAYGGGATSLSAGIPLVISSMWEKSGLTAWRAAQFGASTEANTLSDRAWCRMLEWNAGTSADNVPELLRKADPTMQNSPSVDQAKKSLAFAPMTVEQKDRSIIAWSACKLKTPTGNANVKDSWEVVNGFQSLTDKKIEPKHCAAWWDGSDDNLKQFDWPTKTTGIAERAGGQDSIKNYVETLHGNQNGDGAIASIAFVISSLVAFCVFGLVSLGILVAKIVQVMMIITLFVTAIGILTPRGSMEKFGRAMKSLIGVTVFIFGIQLIFAFLSQITNMIQKTGSTLLSGDTTWITLWTGLSPAIAVFVMHLVFTKILKVPSPFKISGGLAWAGAAGAGGAAAMGGLSRMLDRPGSKMARGAMSAGRRSMNGALGKVSGGRLGSATGNGSTGRSQSGEVKPAKTGGKGVDTRSALEVAKSSMPTVGTDTAKSQTGETSGQDSKGTADTESAATAVAAESSEGAQTEGPADTAGTPAAATAGAASPEGTQTAGASAAAAAAAAAGAAGVTAAVGAAAGASGKSPLIETVGTSSNANAGPGRASGPEGEAGNERADGKKKKVQSTPIDPTILAYSGVNNSGLDQGKMSRAERQQMRTAREKELADAKAFQKASREEMGLGDKPDTKRARAAEGLHNALARAKEDKVGTARKIAKGAVIGTGVIAATAVVPWAVPAAAGYYATKGGVSIAKKNTKAARNAKNDEMVNNYRTKVKYDHAEMVKAQRRAEQEAAKKGKPAGSESQNPVTGGQSGKPKMQRRTRSQVQSS